MLDKNAVMSDPVFRMQCIKKFRSLKLHRVCVAVNMECRYADFSNGNFQET